MRLLRSLFVLLCWLGLAALALPARAQISGSSIFLVASTQMSDPRFARAVLLVTRHGRSPPLGVIINRQLDATLGSVFPKLPKDAAARHLFFGGPVAPTSLTFLFRSAAGSDDAIAVSKDVHLGRSGATLADLLRGNRQHNGLRVFVGYAGWADGQLEHEIRRGSWHVLPVDQTMLFDKDVELIWPELIRRATQQSAQLPSSRHSGAVPS